MPSQNPESILFLYEGDTDFEFYSKVFALFLPKRKIRFAHSNLKGIHNINSKVKRKILGYLDKKKGGNFIHIIVAHDREGKKQKKSELKLELLLSDPEIMNAGRVSNIIEVIATQDIESWFLKDIEGVYKYLKVPKKKRRKKFSNTEYYNNKDLSKFCHQHNGHYQKGTKASGLIYKLDIVKIYRKTPELVQMVKYILSLIKD